MGERLILGGGDLPLARGGVIVVKLVKLEKWYRKVDYYVFAIMTNKYIIKNEKAYILI